MKTYTPSNIEIFEVSTTDILTAGEGDWRQDALNEALDNPEEATEDEKQEAANGLAGFYWWSCSPGCLPDGEASGPFDTWDEANEDAGGGEYEENQIALALHLDCDPAELEEERNDHYGLTIYSHGSREYAVGNEGDVETAWDVSLNSYIEECITPEIEKITNGNNLGSYIKFDEDSWKEDARHDGRGHSLNPYDGSEDEQELDGETFYIYRIN